MQILDATALEQALAATTQPAHRTAGVAPFGGLGVTVRWYAGSTLAEISTHDALLLDALNPRGFTLGQLLDSTLLVPDVAITHTIWRSLAGVDVLRFEASELSPNPLVTKTGRRLNAADPVQPKMLVTANPLLPLGSTPTFALTFAVADTAVAGVAAAGSIINTGNQAQAWSITPPGGVTVTPNSGTLAAGDTQVLSVTAAAAGTPSLTLVAAGATITGNPQAITVSSAPSGAPTTATLSGPSGATVDVVHTSRVTLNQPADQAYTITWTRSNSGTGPATSTISIGQTFVDASNTWDATGAGRTVDFTISPSLTRAGRPLSVTVSDPVSAGTWQALTIAPHSRKTGNLGPGTGSGALDATTALALDSATPESNVTQIPGRGWIQHIQGERGTIYMGGDMHTGYAGSEVDRIQLPGPGSAQLTTELDVQPFRAPNGSFSGFGGGGSTLIHRQYNNPMADPSEWRPYLAHQWTMQSWHPDWGFLGRAPHALQASYPGGAYTVVGDILQSSGRNPPSMDGPELVGIVSLDWSTKKWTTRFPLLNSDYGGPNSAGWVGHTGVSDWNEFSNSMLFITTGTAGRTYLKAWHRSTNTLQDLGFTDVIGGASGVGDNGVIVRHLEGEKYLMVRRGTGATFADVHKCILFNRAMGAGEARFAQLTWPAEASTGVVGLDHDVVTFCVDKNSRRIFWLIAPGSNVPMRFYVSFFDTPMTWIPLVMDTSFTTPGAAIFDVHKTPLWFHDGWLYVATVWDNQTTYSWSSGQLKVKRSWIDGGEELPAMTFTRYDYDAQNFAFSSDPGVLSLRSTKHANMACRTSTGEHIQCSGDLGGNGNTSMAKLTISGAGPTQYLFTELLNETSFPGSGGVLGAPFDPVGGARMKRPAAPDDGAWWYSSAANPNPAFRDKFIFMRGSDGYNFSHNAYCRTAYRPQVDVGERAAWDSGNDPGAPSGVAAMQADGWTLDKLMVYDPDKNGFFDQALSSWTIDSAGWSVTSPFDVSQAACRNGCFDESTNTAFRFINYGGTMVLASFNLTTRVAKLYNCGTWVDTAGIMGPAGRSWYTAGQQPTTETVTANGFGWFYADAGRWQTGAAAPWEHKGLWIDKRDGKLYVVSAQTGYLWCYETRGTETSVPGDGYRLPFYPVGARIPLSGTYPAVMSLRQWPPVRWDQPGAIGNADTSMNSYLVPFKGGLLWWSSAHHDQGAFGRPLYAFWRRLGYTGPWTVVSMPREFAANSYSCGTHFHDNAEVIGLSGGGNSEDGTYGNGAAGLPAGRQKYFWRIT